MPLPGNTEPGATSGQLEVQQQSSIQFSSAIPIKKRRFPIIQPRSPSSEEKASNSDANDSKNKQESNVLHGKLSLSDVKNTAPPSNSDVSKSSAFIVKKEDVTPTRVELERTNVDDLASKPQEAKSLVSLGSIDDLKNKRDVMLNEKCTEPRVPGISMSAQTASVKQEIVSAQVEDVPRLELTMNSMNVELSLGLKEPRFPDRCEKLDPTLLSLASSKENLSLDNQKGNTAENITIGVSANRSNWDLNTTMDVWEGSTVGNTSVHQHVDSGDFSKAKRCNNDKLALNTAGTVGLSLNKGKQILGDHKSNSSSTSTQSGQHYKIDDSLGLKLAMPSRESNINVEHPLPGKLVSTNVSPNLQQVRVSTMNANRAVKSEPADENSKCERSIGSGINSNITLPTISYVKRELVNNPSLETVLPPTTSPGKLIDHRSVKSEAIVGNREAGNCKDTILPQSVTPVMQHQDSCASSSALPLPSIPEKSCHSALPTCSESTKNGDLINQSEHSLQSKESLDHNDRSDECIAGMASKSVCQGDNQSMLCDVGNSSLEIPDKFESARVDEHTLESCQSGDVAANDEEKINIPAEILEEDPFGSDSESQEMDIDEDNADKKENEEFEDGEVREASPHSTGGNPTVEGEKTQNLKLAECNSQNLHHSMSPGIENVNASTSEEKVHTRKNHDDTSSNMIKDSVNVCYEPSNEDSTSQRASDKVTELKSISVALEKQPDASGTKVVERSPVSGNTPIKGSHGMKAALAAEATDKVIREICSGETDSTLSKEEASLNDQDGIKDSNNIGNKSRIINLSRTTNRLPTSRSGKERYSDLDGDIQPRANRDEFYIGGPKKFVKDRVHDRSMRNSFMRGRGRISGRFGSLRKEWDSEHDFASENYRGPTDFRAIRRKHAPSISNVDLDCNGYGVPQDGTPLGSSRRKEINDEFPSLRRTSLRRMSLGDRDGTDARGIQMLRRIPRNMSPSGCVDEDCSDIIGIHHGNKFMRHLSDDMIDPVYGRQQVVYDELDGQLLRGNRNFRSGYPRMGSKSPVRSRTRSPGPWLSPRRRSPNGPSGSLYRMGRMRSPERACFRDEMIRRRGSPSYIPRHPNELRNADSGRDHAHHRSANSHRRNSPSRAFPRNTRRADTLDSQEMGEGSNEYMNGPFHPNKFHGDGSTDERRNFIERRGPPIRSFLRPIYSGDSDDFQFHQNEGPRPYVDDEFIERSGNMRGREFDGHVKHQPMVMSRRVRNIDEQTIEQRAWQHDGYTDTRMKRMRF